MNIQKNVWADLKDLLNSIFYQIESPEKKIKGVYLKIDEETLKLFAVNLPDYIKELEKTYLNTVIYLKEFPHIKECLTSRKVIPINENNIQNMGNSLIQRFEYWQFNSQVKSMTLIPIVQKELEPLGVVIINDSRTELPEEVVQRYLKIFEEYYALIQDSLEIYKIKEKAYNYENEIKKYKALFKFMSNLNQLKEPLEVFQLVIGELTASFGFDMGFIQMEKNGKLPIITGYAKDQESQKILNSEIDYFCENNNPPSLNHLEMACCNFFLNNIHFHIQDMAPFYNNGIALTMKDRMAIDIAERKIKSLLQIPVREEGKPVGIVQLWALKNNVKLTDNDIDMIIDICSFIPSILRNSGLYQLTLEQRKNLEEKNKIILHQNQKLTQELQLAEKILEELIPHNPPEIEGLSLCAKYKPMEAIGGDFFDFIYFDDENLLGVFMCDVSGHGLPAALVASMVKIALETSEHRKFYPAQLMKFINQKLVGKMNRYYLTGFYGIFNKLNKTFSYARAGHPYPYVIREDGSYLRFKAKGSLIGLFKEMDIEEETIQLKSKDKIILYTDGLMEAKNLQHGHFANEFTSILNNKKDLSIYQLIDEIYHHVEENYVMKDDICLLGLEVD